MEPKYYCELKAFGKKICRPILEGTDEMLNAKDEKPLVEIRNLDITYGSNLKKF